MSLTVKQKSPSCSAPFRLCASGRYNRCFLTLATVVGRSEIIVAAELECGELKRGTTYNPISSTSSWQDQDKDNKSNLTSSRLLLI